MIIKRKNFVFASITWTISGLCLFTNVFCNQLSGSYDKNFEPFLNSKINEISDLNKKEELENLFSQIVSLRDMLRGRGINGRGTSINNEYEDLTVRLSEKLKQAVRQTDIRAVSTFLFDTVGNNYNRQAGLLALYNYRDYRVTDLDLLSKLYVFLHYEDKYHNRNHHWQKTQTARMVVANRVKHLLGLENVDSVPAIEIRANPREWLISNLELAKQLDQNKKISPLIESSLKAYSLYNKNFETFFNSKINEISDLNKKEELENLFSQIVSLRDMFRGRGIDVRSSRTFLEYMDLTERLSEKLLLAVRQTDIRAISTFIFDTVEDNFNRQAGLSALREYKHFKITDIQLLSKLYVFLDCEDKYHQSDRRWVVPSIARSRVSRYIETVLGLRNVDSAPAKEMYSNPRKWLISNLELAKQLDQNKDFLPLIESSLEAVQINYGIINSVKIKKDNVDRTPFTVPEPVLDPSG